MVEHNFMLYVTVQLLLIKDNKILLMKRKNTGYEDENYASIGGYLEENEDFRTAIMREVREEVNIVLDREKLKFLSVVHRKGSTQNYVNIFFYTNDYSGEIKNNEPDKCYEIKWFEMNNLPTNMAEMEKRVIENYAKSNCLIEYGW